MNAYEKAETLRDLSDVLVNKSLDDFTKEDWKQFEGDYYGIDEIAAADIAAYDSVDTAIFLWCCNLRTDEGRALIVEEASRIACYAVEQGNAPSRDKAFQRMKERVIAASRKLHKTGGNIMSHEETLSVTSKGGHVTVTLGKKAVSKKAKPFHVAASVKAEDALAKFMEHYNLDADQILDLIG
jgi:hypothetical protein